MMVVMGDTGLRTTIPPTRFKLINQYLEYTGDGCRRQEAHTTTARGSHQGVWETGALHRGTSETVGHQGLSRSRTPSTLSLSRSRTPATLSRPNLPYHRHR